jgi:uridine kinase
MELRLKALWREPLFRIGLLIRLILVLLAVPAVQAKWFVPFLRAALHHPSLDPWSRHLAAGGDVMAFPYGPVMYLIHLPPVLLGAAIDEQTGLNFFALAAFGLTILALDIACLSLLVRLLHQSVQRVIGLYWLSPIVLYICYWHGQTDLVPVFFLLACLNAIEQRRFSSAGVGLGFAISAKLSMILPAPLLVIYFLRNKRIGSGLVPFAASAAGIAALVQGPFLLSHGVQQMVLRSPEIDKIYRVAVSIGEYHFVYVLPLTYFLLLYAAWRIGRMSFALLYAFLGIAFFLVLLLTPASIGWFLWTVPFLVAHQASGGRAAILLVSGYSALLICFHLANSTGAYIRWLDWNLLEPLFPATNRSLVHLHSLWLTILTAIGGMLALRMMREGVQRNDYYRLSRRPLAIAIAGDSGSGKDTLARALAGLFGERSVASVTGDDYHNWDRHAPMWKALTHLNPQANDLIAFSRDVLSLLDGNKVYSRHYDHKSGRFQKASAIGKNDVLLVSGLHALAIPALLPRFDAKLFLDMSEPLRRFYKIRRDVVERGHSIEAVVDSLDRRYPDAVRFVHPQAAAADIVFSLEPVNPDSIADLHASGDPELRISITLRGGVYQERLVRILIGLCGLHVDCAWLPEAGGIRIMIEGFADAEDIAMAAGLLIPHMDELLALIPEWRGGMIGIMQLVTLVHVSEAIRERVLD